MKTFVKLASLALVVLMSVACLVACGGNKENAYFIGCTGPLTGDAASYGISVQKGAQLAVKQINANGGLNGVSFKFDMKDDQADAAAAQTGYNALYDAGMQISLGSVTSGSCKAFAAKAQQDNLLFMTPSASEAAILEDYAGGTTAFRVCFGDPDQGVLAADEIKEKGYTKIGAIYDTSSSYSVGIYEAFKAEMNKLGLSYIETTFDQENNKDFSTQVEAMKDCEIIFMPFYYTEASLIAKTAANKGCNAILFGCDGFDGIAAMFTAEDNIPNEIKYITPFDAASTDATVKAFVDAFKAEYNETPDQFAADGYDAVMALYEAMKAAGINDVNISASDLADAVRAVLVGGSFSFKGATGTMSWDNTGACKKSAQIVVLEK